MTKSKFQKKRDVPSTDHIVRYCNPQLVIRDPLTQAVLAIFPQAFELRQHIKELYVSAHWMEYFGNSLSTDKQYKNVLNSLRIKHKGVKKEGAFARLKVAQILDVGNNRKHPIRVKDRSSEKDPAYASIEGMPLDNSDNELLALLAYDCCIEVREVADIDALP